MQGVTKVDPPNKTVLKDIWLSFYYGAKIGVLGLNGAGKSSLLRIMAGEITEHGGEAKLTQNHTVGYLSQEPQLDPAKTVLQNLEEGVAPGQVRLEAGQEGAQENDQGCTRREGQDR